MHRWYQSHGLICTCRMIGKRTRDCNPPFMHRESISGFGGLFTAQAIHANESRRGPGVARCKSCPVKPIDLGNSRLRQKFNTWCSSELWVPRENRSPFQIIASMNACTQSTTLDSPPRYIPGYFALSSPKSTRPIGLHWPQYESLRTVRPLPSASTADCENHPLGTARITSTPTNFTATSRPPFTDNNNNDASSTLPLVEHANRAEIHRRQKRVELETSEALKGDLEWVRSGGVLRDSNGRRDFVRTKRIRDQLDEQERERRALAAWAEYEDRWRASLLIGRKSSSDALGDQDHGIRFGDVAWPVGKRVDSPDGLTAGAVREFVLAPLRGKDSKRKDRIRQLLLRYHPDKTAFLLSRVTEEEKGQVREGINNVFMSLKLLQGDPEIQNSK